MAPKKTISLGPDHAKRPEVDVFGVAYTVRPITRSVQAALEAAQEGFSKLEDANGDQAFEFFADMLAALLDPTQHSKSARDLLIEKWQADELSLPAIRAFSDELQELAATDRPT